MTRCSAFQAFLLAWLCAGCISIVPSVPSQGGARWLRLEGPHFIVVTNQGDEDARETLDELERFLALFSQFGWSVGSSHPDKVTAVVFENDVELHAFLPHRFGGVFTGRSLYAPLMLAYNGTDGFRSTVVRHELIHYLARLSTPRQPAWFAEGVAGYFETATTTIGSDEVAIGKPHEEAASLLRQEGVLRAEDLLDPTRDVHGRTFYPSAWLLMHYLMSVHQEALIAFHLRLIEGEDPTSAWQAAFPQLTHRVLDVELEKYRERGTYQYAVRELPLADVEDVSVTTLADADVLALRGQMFYENFWERRSTDEAKALALRDLDAALRLEPWHALATITRLHVDTPTMAEVASIGADLTREHPEEWMTWMLRLDGLRGTDTDAATFDAVTTAAITHHPNNMHLLVAAVDGALAVHDADRALAIARKAKQLHGGDAEVLLRYALALFHIGACDTAHNAGQRALLRMPPTQTTEQYASVMLEEANQACRTRTPIAPQTQRTTGLGARP